MRTQFHRSLASWLMRPTASVAIRHVPQAFAVIGTTRGRVRAENQDKAVAAIYAAKPPQPGFRVFVMCDGLGGMQDGGRCAAAGVSLFLSHLTSTSSIADRAQRLRQAVEYTNQELWRMFQERGGTTLAAILFTETGATALAVGDTRIYRHGDKGELTQLTTDDTIAERIAELGHSRAGEVAGGPFAQHLTQVIGQSAPVSPQIIESSLLTNGVPVQSPNAARTGLLVATDGVHRIGKDFIEALGRGASSARELVHRLIDVSEWTGGTDNATAMYVSFQDAPNRGAMVQSEPFGLQIHDAHGELQLVPIEIDARAEVPTQLPPAEPQVAEGKAKYEKRKRASRTKRKGKRSQARKATAVEKNKNPTQPELDIKVTQHSE